MKQNPRVVKLSILNGLLTGFMTIPLDLDRFSLPVPTEAGYLSDEERFTPVSGRDALEFISTGKFVLENGKPVEIFECINYGSNHGS